MNKHIIYKITTYFIALVWIASGLFCKVLNLVPRHQEIVARILGGEHARIYTICIGLGEIIMAVWVVSMYKRRLNAFVQIIIISLMNLLEFFLASALLLWGKINIIFASIFMLLIFYNEFYLVEKTNVAK